MDNTKPEINTEDSTPVKQDEIEIKTNNSFLSPYSDFTPKILRYPDDNSNLTTTNKEVSDTNKATSSLSPYSNFTPKILRSFDNDSNLTTTNKDVSKTKKDSSLLSPYSNFTPKVLREPKNELSQFPLPNGPQVVKTGKSRNKVALEPGYSPLDWARLTTSGADLRGVSSIGGITLDEIQKHKTQDDVWCAIRGKVYNLTSYAKFHPGGVKQLMRGAGKDATELYNKVHPWVNVDQLLKECVVGFLVEN